jgi:hypothetical protein
VRDGLIVQFAKWRYSGILLAARTIQPDWSTLPTLSGQAVET